jgi:hypothetical protein
MKAALLIALLAVSGLVFPLHAQEPAKAVTPDPGVAQLLKQLEYEYEVDEDGDYKLLMSAGETGERSQLVFVRSAVETYGQMRIREIWSYSYTAPGDALPALVANRLLEASNNLIVGGWVKQGRNAMFVIKVPADANAQVLDEAIGAAVATADEMEQELATDVDADEF